MKVIGDEDLPLDLVFASPLNPRKWFDPDSLADMASSMRVHGQLQNLTVRAIRSDFEPTRYELIGGERRFRAANLAELETVRCRVIECDDETAVELRGVENYHREQLNAIEEAIWFQQMLDTGKYNQTTLAAFLNISASQVSNRLRLLDLPPEWIERVATGVCPPTHARTIVAWVHRPVVLKALGERFGFSDEIEGDACLAEISVTHLQTFVSRELHRVTRPMDPSAFQGPKFTPTKQELKALDVEKIVIHGSEVERAWNVELWDELQKQAIDAARAEMQQSAEQGDDDAKGMDVRETRSNLSAYSLDRNFAYHFYRCLAGALKPDIHAVRLYMTALFAGGGDDLLTELFSKSGAVSGDGDREYSHDDSADVLELMGVLTLKNFPDLCCRALQRQFTSSPVYMFDLFELRQLCGDLFNVFPLDTWKPDAQLLDLCSTAQLRELFTPGMASKKALVKWSREKLIKELLAHWPEGYLPPLLTPAAFADPEATDAEESNGESPDAGESDGDSEE